MKNKNIEHSDDQNLQHLQLFFYLIPVVGFFPSLWTLYRHSQLRQQEMQKQPGDRRENVVVSTPLTSYSREQLKASRLSVTLALTWLCTYSLLNIGAETSEFLTLRLLLLNTLLTSGYFLVSIWLMLRLSSHKSTRLPGFSRLAERVISKYLS